jgi:hypothetical protein
MASNGLARVPITILDPRVDTKWALGYNDSDAEAEYFDYFFVGEDMQVYIDGVEEPGKYSQLPVLGLVIRIEQEKQPLYGYASYTYDAVMRGTRIVTGRLMLATMSTNYMTTMISKAAEARSGGDSNYPLRGLDTDQQNIEKYWSRNVDPAAYGLKHIFSTHPPFNLVVVYGVQSTSITDDPTSRNNEIKQRAREGDTPLLTSYNERLVSSNPVGAGNRRVIENVELTNMVTQYTPEGQVCSEVYEFFARDMLLPK